MSDHDNPAAKVLRQAGHEDAARLLEQHDAAVAEGAAQRQAQHEAAGKIGRTAADAGVTPLSDGPASEEAQGRAFLDQINRARSETGWVDVGGWFDGLNDADRGRSS